MFSVFVALWCVRVPQKCVGKFGRSKFNTTTDQYPRLTAVHCILFTTPQNELRLFPKTPGVSVVTVVDCKNCMGKFRGVKLHDHYTSTPPVKGDILQLLPDSTERIAALFDNSSRIPVATNIRCKNCMGKFTPPELDGYYTSAPPLRGDTGDEDSASTPRSGGHTHTISFVNDIAFVCTH